jgi:ABC-type ATPase involved in cell division
MKMMNRYIREVNGQGTAVLLTTHDRLRSAEVASRGGVLIRGQLKEIAVRDLTAADDLF